MMKIILIVLLISMIISILVTVITYMVLHAKHHKDYPNGFCTLVYEACNYDGSCLSCPKIHDINGGTDNAEN